jgi:hypothetical protein
VLSVPASGLNVSVAAGDDFAISIRENRTVEVRRAARPRYKLRPEAEWMIWFIV